MAGPPGISFTVGGIPAPISAAATRTEKQHRVIEKWPSACLRFKPISRGMNPPTARATVEQSDPEDSA